MSYEDDKRTLEAAKALGDHFTREYGQYWYRHVNIGAGKNVIIIYHYGKYLPSWAQPCFSRWWGYRVEVKYMGPVRIGPAYLNRGWCSKCGRRY